MSGVWHELQVGGTKGRHLPPQSTCHLEGVGSRGVHSEAKLDQKLSESNLVDDPEVEFTCGRAEFSPQLTQANSAKSFPRVELLSKTPMLTTVGIWNNAFLSHESEKTTPTSLQVPAFCTYST
ncbi:hypothetical protein M413DRAFT_14050 [Hebeloma cylindrosporum]|uniref:Uncharacterized protein n=1 Tax=Hebeloma cylindrosporum TaxID=76867 RepID=A0A0C3BY69_HEBCY|nr:hypothetical protein M413DRAFT_14050 [Hebeloma cylindrosporum h7]